MARITAADFTAILTRVQAELTRRNGNGDLSGYASSTVFPVADPVATDELVKTSAINTLLTGLGRINSAGLPASVSTGDLIYQSTLDGINTKLTAFEKQPRNATSGNDCSAACSGMCVSQCTTTCSTTCTGGCQTGCTGSCTSSCATGCSNSCTSSCTGTCTGGCQGSCTGTCTGDCYTGCDGCTNQCQRHCGNNCKSTCTDHCMDNCTQDCTGGSK